MTTTNFCTSVYPYGVYSAHNISCASRNYLESVLLFTGTHLSFVWPFGMQYIVLNIHLRWQLLTFLLTHMHYHIWFDFTPEYICFGPSVLALYFCLIWISHITQCDFCACHHTLAVLRWYTLSVRHLSTTPHLHERHTPDHIALILCAHLMYNRYCA